MFKIRYHDGTGYVVTTLDPSPTAVDYPTRRELTKHTTQDGAVVIQRPSIDSRERRWLWINYRKDHAAYAALWTLLESFDAKARAQLSLEPTVEIWENTSGVGGFDRGSEVSPTWTKVRFIHVDRTPSAGGPVYYPESAVTFVVEDPTYTG